MRIKKEVIEKIKGDKEIVARLCGSLNKSYPTIHRWLDENHELLTTASALKVLREELGLTDAQILEESKQTA